MGRFESIIITLVVLAVAIILVFSFAFGYLRHVKITVDDASLTHMELVTTPTTALAYNLSLMLVIRNPNWAIAIKHDKPLDAANSFDGQQFDRAHVADKGDKQRAGKTVVYRLDTSSDGRRSVSLGNAGEASFRKQNATGLFEVEVKLTGKFKYTARYHKCKLEATCPLKLQLAPPGSPAVVFQKVECKLAKPENKYC
ncbi:unnamed protein product [Miscanthus lutarioriparius]|uniref:Late embryogenesis abundant protein LEA-2 subgroup domain-containing protein n=1 Tax=Miscanthus lutarioriparius TaxID=422564 RepID=A0A811NDT9_9POAL|nr:unnamed protein product [Miscanthus lutarioriparius]